MLMSVLSVVIMAVTAIYMLNKANFAKTRRMALIPLACAAVELLAAGMLTPALFPALTAVLILLRAVILVCCWFALRQDFLAHARRRQREAARNLSPARCNPVCGRCA